MSSKVSTSLKLSPEMLQRIEGKMEALSLSKTAVIEKALEEYFQQGPSPWLDERVEKLGLLRLLLICEEPDIEQVKEEVEKLWSAIHLAL